MRRVGAAQEGLVEVELVGVVVAEDPREVAAGGRAVGNHAVQMHDRAVARVRRVGDCHAAGLLVDPPEVAVDVDVLGGQDLRVGVGREVVGDPQQDRALHGVDQAVRERLHHVFQEEDEARGQQVEGLRPGPRSGGR